MHRLTTGGVDGGLSAMVIPVKFSFCFKEKSKKEAKISLRRIWLRQKQGFIFVLHSGPRGFPHATPVFPTDKNLTFDLI